MVAADNKDHRPESRINLQKALESYTHTKSFDNGCKDRPPIRPGLDRKVLGYGRGALEESRNKRNSSRVSALVAESIRQYPLRSQHALPKSAFDK